jgi:hypothetical protein
MARKKIRQTEEPVESEQKSSLAEYIVGCINTYKSELADTLVYRIAREKASNKLQYNGFTDFKQIEHKNVQVDWINSKTADALIAFSSELTQLKDLIGNSNIETFAQYAAKNPEKADKLKTSIESVQNSIDKLVPEAVDQPPLLVFLLDSIRKSLATFQGPTQTVAESEVTKGVGSTGRVQK